MLLENASYDLSRVFDWRSDDLLFVAAKALFVAFFAAHFCFAGKTLLFAINHSKGPSRLGRGTCRVNACVCPSSPLALTTGNRDCLLYDSSADQPVITTDTECRVLDGLNSRLCQQQVARAFSNRIFCLSHAGFRYLKQFGLVHLQSTIFPHISKGNKFGMSETFIFFPVVPYFSAKTRKTPGTRYVRLPVLQISW